MLPGEVRERLDSARAFVQDSLTDGHLGSGDIGNLMSARDEIDRAIALISNTTSAGGWQTMETCPDDGSPVLTFGGRRTEVTCEPADGDYWRFNGSHGPTPTHWMPLPAAPIGSGHG
ncbi:MAG: DUF551 domain-containing protein [Hyphomonadaceae bacterium]|nr:DUF551 domain-containing protein [Hyphomonadaceae bacterium]